VPKATKLFPPGWMVVGPPAEYPLQSPQQLTGQPDKGQQWQAAQDPKEDIPHCMVSLN